MYVCSVLQRVAVCCNMLQCVAVNSGADRTSDVRGHTYMFAVYCSVAVCCSVLQLLQCVAISSCAGQTV